MRKIEVKKMRDCLTSEHGITLVEMIVVVALIGIIGGFAVIGFDFINRERLSSATTELVADIQRVRVEAMTEGQTTPTHLGYGIRFSPGTSSYTLFTWYDDTPTDFQYDVSEERDAETNSLNTKLSLTVADLQQVRVKAVTASQAVATGRGYGIRFTPTTSYTRFTWNDADNDFEYDGISEEIGADTTTLKTNLSLNILDLVNPTYTVLIYERSGLPKRYEPGGSTSIAGNMVITLSEASSSLLRCIQVGTNTMRKGVISGATCTQF
jgi:prepilin-type N-terminal cleavage/methylation domain-containing protein